MMDEKLNWLKLDSSSDESKRSYAFIASSTLLRQRNQISSTPISLSLSHPPTSTHIQMHPTHLIKHAPTQTHTHAHAHIIYFGDIFSQFFGVVFDDLRLGATTFKREKFHPKNIDDRPRGAQLITS